MGSLDIRCYAVAVTRSEKILMFSALAGIGLMNQFRGSCPTCTAIRPIDVDRSATTSPAEVGSEHHQWQEGRGLLESTMGLQTVDIPLQTEGPPEILDAL